MRWLRVVAAMIAVLLGITTLATSPAHAEPPHPTRDGSRYLATCLQSAKTLNVLVLLDRSGSLANTDPDDVRYDGLLTALNSLSQRTRPDGQAIAIQVAVAAFDQEYVGAKSIAGWTRINGADSEKTIDRLMERTRANTFNPNGSTNFQAALDGALKEFDGRTGVGTCNALLWFTDGEFEVSGGVDVTPLRDEMCRKDGVVDQIREMGVVVIGVQLGDQDFDLKPMSLGEGAGQTCGTVPFPETNPPGIYLRADEAGTLSRVLGGLGLLLQGCSDAGPSGLIDPGIRRMIVSVPTAKRVSKIWLRTPDGENLDIAANGGSAVAGYTTQGTAYDGFASIEITFPPGRGAGQWEVSADQSIDKEEISFCVFSDLSLIKDDNQNVPAGPGATITAQVVDMSSTPASMADFVGITASATVLGADGKPRIAHASVDAAGEVAITIEADPRDARLDVEAKVEFETQSGVSLTPLILRFGQQLMLSEDYPSVSPADVLDLGAAIKRGAAQAEFTLRGSPKGETEVCFDAPSDLVVPPEAQGTTLDYEHGCVGLGVGEVKTMSVSMTPLSAAVGDGSALVPVELHPIAASADAGTSSMEVPVTWRFEDPLNPWAVLVTTIIVAALSLVLPVLALFLANWLAARYSTGNLGHATTPVTIKGDGFVMENEPTPVSLTKISIGKTTARRFEVDGLRFRSKVPLDPSIPPEFWVEPAPGQALVATPSIKNESNGSRAEVSPGLGLLAIVQASAAKLGSSDAQVPGTLTVLARRRLDPAEMKTALAGLDVSSLRRHLQTSDPVDEESSSGSTPTLSDDDVWND